MPFYVDQIIEKKVNVNQRFDFSHNAQYCNEAGWNLAAIKIAQTTPLYWAVKECHLNLVKILLAEFANHQHEIKEVRYSYSGATKHSLIKIAELES